jgi:hypothetical protein
MGRMFRFARLRPVDLTRLTGRHVDRGWAA